MEFLLNRWFKYNSDLNQSQTIISNFTDRLSLVFTMGKSIISSILSTTCIIFVEISKCPWKSKMAQSRIKTYPHTVCDQNQGFCFHPPAQTKCTLAGDKARTHNNNMKTSN